MILYSKKYSDIFFLSKQVISDSYFDRKIKYLLIKIITIEMIVVNKLRIGYKFHFFLNPNLRDISLQHIFRYESLLIYKQKMLIRN